jgi:hypothetical protein
VRVAINGSQGTAHWTNVFWCLLTTGGTIVQADLDTWLTAFQLAFKTRFGPQQLSSISYTSAQGVLFAPGGGELLSVLAMTGAGTLTGVSGNDASQAACVSWSANVYWRGGKPRTYIAGPNTSSLTGSQQLASGVVTNMATAAANFRTDVNALTATSITGTTLGFVSFRTGNAERVPPVFYPFVGSRVHPRVASQRRRLGAWVP